MKRLCLATLLLLLLIPSAVFGFGLHYFDGLTGGAAANLDGISVNNIDDGDWAEGVYNSAWVRYEYNASSTDSESSPKIIVPDDNSSGTGAWEQRGSWRNVMAKTADYTLVAADCGKMITNDGAAADITLTVLDTSAGYNFTVANVEDGYTIYVDPPATDIFWGICDSIGDRMILNARGETVTAEAQNTTEWCITGYQGSIGDAD